MNYDAFRSLCEQRRSIRHFESTPVSKEEVQKLLDLARLAPSVENLQPWHFHVILNEDLKHKLVEASCYGNFVDEAPVFIVITANRSLEQQAESPVWNPKELEYSCMAAAEHILLGATAMGLGSCWVSLHHGTAHEMLGLPMHEIVVGGLMLGHAKTDEGQSERQRKAVDEMYTLHE